MTGELLSAHDVALAEAIARLVVALLEERQQQPTAPRLVDAATLARVLGVSRSTVYEHAARLGAIELGDGKKPRLGFDVDRAREAWTHGISGERSQAAEPPELAGVRRRRQSKPSGSSARLLPVKGQAAA